MTNAPTNSQSDPLAMLDQLLKKEGAPAGSPDAAAVSDATTPDQEAVTAARLAEIQALEQQRKQEDEVALSMKQQELAAITSTPEDQARLQQQAEAKHQAETDEEARLGFEIKQVGHDKVQE